MWRDARAVGRGALQFRYGFDVGVNDASRERVLGALGAPSESGLADGSTSIGEAASEFAQRARLGGFVVRGRLGDERAETDRRSENERVTDSPDALTGIINETQEGESQSGSSRELGQRVGEDELNSALREGGRRKLTKSG